MSREPATRHFTPAELAEFLKQLGEESASPSHAAPVDAGAPKDPLTRLQRPRPLERSARAAGAEPPTVLGTGHVIDIGAPRWRTRVRMRALAAPAAPTQQQAAASFDAQGSVEREVLRLTRVKPWRLAFLITALLSLGLLAILTLRSAPHDPRVSKTLRPPPLPAQPDESTRSPHAGTARPSDESARSSLASSTRVPTGPSATSVSQPLEIRRPRSEPMAAPQPQPRQVSPGASQPARIVTPAPQANARREAVDLLLSGHNSAALDAYRALLSSVGSGAEATALQHVVRLLEREQAACAQQKGTSCSL